VAATPTIGILRPALELAWGVAKAGTLARPPIPPPGRLRPLMRFAKLPDRALTTVRQVVDDDTDFRLRVADWAEEAQLERASWLWLARPEGWEEELGSLTDAAGAAASELEEKKEERQARRRLEAAQLALARAEAELAERGQAHADLSAELAAERQARRRAETGLHAAEAALRAADSGQGDLRETIAALEGRVSSLLHDLHDSTTELTRSNQDRDVARERVSSLTEQLRAAGVEAARARRGRDDAGPAVGRAVAEAAAAAQHLSDALAKVAGLVGGDSHRAERQPAAADPEATFRAGPSAPAGGNRPASTATAPRQPVSLPPAIFDDSFEAAEHLVRVPGILLIVDGYNVTISSWPHLELARQRHQLVDALAELAMRAGPRVHVVFDGNDAGNRFGPPAAARRRMRVTFSAEGVEADQVIVDLVDQLDPSQPVVVATDDRQVRAAVRRRGANVISVAQLLAVVRRAPGSAAG
jgi:predicted RNA-binding protein with PIN domain